MAAKQVAGLNLSVDLTSTLAGASAAGVESAVAALADCVGRHALPITWGLADLASDLAQRLDQAERHELALLVDAQELSVARSRVSLVDELGERLEQAGESGLSIHSISVRGAGTIGHLETLARFGIAALRESPAVEAPRSWMARWLAPKLALPAARRPRMLVSGLWSIPGVLQFERHSADMARSLIERSIATGDLLTVVIDASRMHGDLSRSLQALDRWLGDVVAELKSGRLEMLSLGQLAARQQGDRRAGSTKSILRRAA